ncbi:MAG TPA: hypothetical protein VIZ43_17515 [Trebonia sp.]
MSDEANDSMPDFPQMPREWWQTTQQQAVQPVHGTGTTAGLPFVLDPA